MDVNELGGRMRRRRQTLGLTLAAVAAKAEVSVPYIANLERGHGNPTIEVLRKVARALDWRLAELIGSEDQADAPALIAALPRSLREFAATKYFAEKVGSFAAKQGVEADEMRLRVLNGMVSAPRRAAGEPTKDDWRRLLDTYTLILER